MFKKKLMLTGFFFFKSLRFEMYSLARKESKKSTRSVEIEVAVMKNIRLVCENIGCIKKKIMP